MGKEEQYRLCIELLTNPDSGAIHYANEKTKKIIADVVKQYQSLLDGKEFTPEIRKDLHDLKVSAKKAVNPFENPWAMVFAATAVSWACDLDDLDRSLREMNERLVWAKESEELQKRLAELK